MFKIRYSKRALKDLEKLASVGLDGEARKLIELVRIAPYQPEYEKLKQDRKGELSRQINEQHRFTYRVDHYRTLHGGKLYEGLVEITQMWGHYDDPWRG